jgi:hypothetical protein
MYYISTRLPVCSDVPGLQPQAESFYLEIEDSWFPGLPDSVEVIPVDRYSVFS